MFLIIFAQQKNTILVYPGDYRNENKLFSPSDKVSHERLHIDTIKQIFINML